MKGDDRRRSWLRGDWGVSSWTKVQIIALAAGFLVGLPFAIRENPGLMSEVITWFGAFGALVFLLVTWIKRSGWKAVLPWMLLLAAYVAALFVPSSNHVQESVNIYPKTDGMLVAKEMSGSVRFRPCKVLADGELAPGYHLAVDSGEGRTDWIMEHEGYIECRYPNHGSWGGVFITVGFPAERLEDRQTKDLSGYRFLILDLRGIEAASVSQLGSRRTPTRMADGSQSMSSRSCPGSGALLKFPFQHSLTRRSIHGIGSRGCM